MRRLRVGFAAAVCCAALIGIAPPCLACSCIASTDAEHFSRADVVFTGTAVERHDPAAVDPTKTSADPIHWTFERESIQKGDVGARPVVTSTRDEASCGFTFQIGKRYQVFARKAGSELETNLCDGTRQLGAGQQPYTPPAATPAPPAPPTPAPATPAPATPTPTLAPSPTSTLAPAPSATPPFFSPEATPTAADDTSSLPAVLAFVGAVGALGLAVTLARLRPPSG